MRPPGADDPFAEGIALYVKTYSQMQATDGNTLHVEEVISALLTVVAMAIEHVPPSDYRRRLIAVTHAALDDRLGLTSPKTNTRH